MLKKGSNYHKKDSLAILEIDLNGNFLCNLTPQQHIQ